MSLACWLYPGCPLACVLLSEVSCWYVRLLAFLLVFFAVALAGCTFTVHYPLTSGALTNRWLWVRCTVCFQCKVVHQGSFKSTVCCCPCACAWALSKLVFPQVARLLPWGCVCSKTLRLCLSILPCACVNVCQYACLQEWVLACMCSTACLPVSACLPACLPVSAC